MRNCHAWNVREEDHIKREIRVSKEASRWRFQSKREDATNWTYHQHPPEADLIDFIEILDRKYQRRRASHADILLAKEMLAQLKAPTPLGRKHPKPQ
jgi:hypothetical protein